MLHQLKSGRISYTVFTTLSDGSRTPTDFETSFQFDFQFLWSHDTICVESVSKGKIGWEIAPKIVSCDRTFNIYTGVWYRL